MKKLHDKITLEMINYIIYTIGLCAICATLAFFGGQASMDTISPPKPSYEQIKGYVDDLAKSEIEADNRRLAQLCVSHAPVAETVKVPMWMEYTEQKQECNCDIEHELGYLDGVEDGIAEGWKTAQAIPDTKQPKRTVKEARNYRDSRNNIMK